MRIILLGNGGHSKVIQEMVSLIRGWKVTAILDDKDDIESEESGIIRGPISVIHHLLRQNDFKVIVAIGNNAIRKKVVDKLKLKPEQYATIIHPTSVISPSVTIGNGTVVMPNAVINAETKIGRHCIINTSSIVEHENKIGDYAHISPNVTLTGNVTIGEGVHMGASSIVIPGKMIEHWSVIGAGSTVIDNIHPHTKAVGSPSRIIGERVNI